MSNDSDNIWEQGSDTETEQEQRSTLSNDPLSSTTTPGLAPGESLGGVSVPVVSVDAKPKAPPAASVAVPLPKQGVAGGVPTDKSDLTNKTHMEIVFSFLFKGLPDGRKYKADLLTTFTNPKHFYGEYFVFYLLINNHKNLPSYTEDFLTTFLRFNGATFKKHPNIDLSPYSIGDDDPYVEFTNHVLTVFRECVALPVDYNDFMIALETYKMDIINQQAITALEEGAAILSDGLVYNRKTLSGYGDARNHIIQGFTQIDMLVAKSDRKGIIVYENDDDEVDEEESKVKLITKFGVDELDEHLEGVFEGDMVSILAPAKGCKSRFSVQVQHTALISGQDIVIWSVENGSKGWEALIRARHFNYFYNQNTDGLNRRFINSDDIRKGQLPADIREMERVSWADLRTNERYGRIVNLDFDFKLESFLDRLDEGVNIYGAKFVCLDYLQLIDSDNPRILKNERIAEAYKKTLQYLKSKKIAGIFPAQFKQTVVGDIGSTDAGELADIELRDAAGETYEVIKTPDLNIALYGTPQSIRNGDMKILSIPSRNSSPFNPIQLHVDAGACTFQSVSA